MRKIKGNPWGALLILFAVSGCSPGEEAIGPPEMEPVATRMVRINADQYRRIIRDVFGTRITVTQTIESPGVRVNGLLAVGASTAGFTSSGYAALEAAAQEVASQVIADRLVLLPCGPANAINENCAHDFLARAGRMLWRRTLTEAELQEILHTTSEAAEILNDYYQGVEMGLVRLLVAPEFLFRIERARVDPSDPERWHLDGVSKASRLSFLLWDSTPDVVLLDAAESGELDNQAGLERHVDRMLDSPRLVDGTRAFFRDMFSLSEFDTFTKDAFIFPNFTTQVALDAPEQMLKTVVDLLLYDETDYRDLFTSRKTFMTPSLAALLGIPLATTTRNGDPDHWQPYRFAEGDPRAGLLAMPAFVALHSHAGRTSPTIRGKAVREQIMCQEIPPPPAAVDFNLDQDQSDPAFMTTRQRLMAHAIEPACAGCHKVTDPIGLPLESFDGSGAFRLTENGQAIDTRGDLGGVQFDDAAGLAEALRRNREVPRCLAERIYAYGQSDSITRQDRRELMQINEAFAEADFRFKALLRIVLTHEPFYTELASVDLTPGEVAELAQPVDQSNLALAGVEND